MPWYGREFYADENVLVMTLEQEGAYLRLLWNCWQEGSIPTDTAKLAALCKNSPQKKFERDIWPMLRDLFVARDDGRLVHHKVESLRAAKEQRRTERSAAGRRGNQKRWGSDTNQVAERSLSDQTVIAKASVPIADCRLPSTEYREKEQTLCSSDDERGGGAQIELTPLEAKPERVDEVKVWFDGEFWPAYPRKVSKPQGLKAARRHGKTAMVRAAIMECLRLKLPALQEQFRADGDYRPYPASWLNQTPWIDPEEAGRPSGDGPRSNRTAMDEAIKLLDEDKRGYP